MQTFSPLRASTLGLQPNNYIYNLVPTSKGLAAISSDDSLRIFDPESSQSHILARLDVHKSVTCLRGCTPFKDFPADLVATAGRDGVVRFWDVRGDLSRPVIECVSDFQISALDCNSKSVVAGAELESDGPGEASVLLWDISHPQEPKLEFRESHTDTITELQIYSMPFSPPLLLSGSTDGLINVFDLTASQTADDEEPLQVVNHGSAVHHAGFLFSSPRFKDPAPNPGWLYGLSTDETFSIYPMGEEEENEEVDEEMQLKSLNLFGDVRGFLGCEYVIDFKAEMPVDAQAPVMVVGNHSEQWVEVIPCSQRPSRAWQFDTAACIRLSSAHGNDIVRDVHIDHDSGTIFTCGEDGFVRAWRGSSREVGEDVDMEEDTVSKPAKREIKRKKTDAKVKEGRSKLLRRD